MEKKLIPYITSQILFSRLCDRNRSLSQNGADEHARYGSISNDMRKWFLWKIRSQWIWKFCSVVPETITSSRVAVVWWIEGTALLVREKTPINVKFKRLAMVASHVCHKKGENTVFTEFFEEYGLRPMWICSVNVQCELGNLLFYTQSPSTVISGLYCVKSVWSNDCFGKKLKIKLYIKKISIQTHSDIDGFFLNGCFF